MNRIKFQSYVEQLDITISNPEFGVEYYEDTYNLIMSDFSFKDIIELDIICENRKQIEAFWSWAVYSITFENLISRDINQVEVSLNEIDFVAYLIKYKSIIINENPLSKIIIRLKNLAIKVIDNRIIQNISFIRNHLENGISNDKEALGVFFVNEKSHALRKYEHYIFHRSAVKTYDAIAQNLNVSLGRLKDIISLKHIPHINYLNYEKSNIFNNNSSEFVSFREIEDLIKNFNYFRREYPLAKLNKKELLDWEVDIRKKNEFSYVLESYFKEKLDLSSDVFGNRIYEVFISSICRNYPKKFRVNELIPVQELISARLANITLLQGLVTVLSILNDQKLIKNATARFPKIFMYYIKGISVKEDAIEGYFKRPGKSVKYIYENMANWLDLKLP